jgi:arylsulfatase
MDYLRREPESRRLQVVYQIADDFAQANDLAAREPAKLKELQQVFDREAKKYNVYPLDSSFAERADPALRPSLTRGRAAFTYYQGMIRIPEGTAPNVKNKSYTMTAEVEIPSGGAGGVLGTLGGRFGGRALLLVDSKPEIVFAYSNQPQNEYRVDSSQALGPGKHTIEFDFKYDGGGIAKGGTGTLIVDGKQVAQGRIEHTIRARFTLGETMDFGEDTGTPVVKDSALKMPFKFTGTLHKFVIHLGESQLSAADQKDLDEAARKAAAIRQ